MESHFVFLPLGYSTEFSLMDLETGFLFYVSFAFIRTSLLSVLRKCKHDDIS